MVSSLHDGMNLVAKEFVSARPDGDTALILSRFTGAARELEDAIHVNPYGTESFADAIKLALELDEEEKQKRFNRMRETVLEHNVYDWAAKVVAEISKIV